METNILFIILVTFFAGMGAGLGTGFAGMSAAAVISPMLIAFLKMDPYMAVRSEEHTSELQSPEVISYAVFCLKKKK